MADGKCDVDRGQKNDDEQLLTATKPLNRLLNSVTTRHRHPLSGESIGRIGSHQTLATLSVASLGNRVEATP